MNYGLKVPCHECPFIGNTPGWIGSHETAQDFVDLVRADMPFPCHETVDQDSPDPIEAVLAQKVAHCAGYALFMSRMCKLSRRPELAAMQQRLKETCKVPVLWPPDELVRTHDESEYMLKRMNGEEI